MWRTLVLSSFALATAVKPPSYLGKCSISSPDLNDCAFKTGQQAIPHLLKGDKSLGIPSLTPLFVPSIFADYDQLTIDIKNASFIGAEKAILSEINIDPEHQFFNSTIFVPEASLIGTYKMKGRILVLTLEGEGFMNVTIENSYLSYEFNWKEENGYLKTIEDTEKVNMNMTTALLHFDNLLNDEALSKHMNEFLNENWREAFEELGSPIKQTLGKIFKTVVVEGLLKIKKEDLFLD